MLYIPDGMLTVVPLLDSSRYKRRSFYLILRHRILGAVWVFDKASILRQIYATNEIEDITLYYTPTAAHHIIFSYIHVIVRIV